jgi:hypothetical protein
MGQESKKALESALTAIRLPLVDELRTFDIQAICEELRSNVARL